MRIVSIIMGVLLLVGGVYCMLTPIATYAVLSWLIGLSMVVEGIGSVILWNELRKEGLSSGWMLAGAIISILLGVFLLGSYAAQFALDVFIAYFIAIWFVVGGIARIVTALSARTQQNQVAYGATQTSWVALLVLGIISVILGILCLFNPLAIVIGFGFMLGLSIAFTGVGLIVCAVRMQA